MSSRPMIIVDYGMGNLRSVSKALEALGGRVEISDRRRDIRSAPALVLPGVGHFGAAASQLHTKGIWSDLRSAILGGTPFLGICLGYQLLFDRSEEAPGASGLAVLDGQVRRLRKGRTRLKLPHMGWNEVRMGTSGEYFYFVHTYAPVPADRGIVSGWTSYGRPFASSIGTPNITACQFHPEKSQAAGLTYLKQRFLEPFNLL